MLVFRLIKKDSEHSAGLSVLTVPNAAGADGGESCCQRLAAADLAQRPASALMNDSCQRDQDEYKLERGE